MLNGTIPFSVYRQLLTRLGFVETRVKGSHIVFHHQPTETLLVSPRGTKRVTAPRLASVRQIVTGRGVTSEARFDSLLDTICGQKV